MPASPAMLPARVTPARRRILRWSAIVALALGAAGWQTLRWQQRVPATPAEVAPASLRDDLARVRRQATAWWLPGQLDALRDLAFLHHANALWAAAGQLYALLERRDPKRADWPELAADVALQQGNRDAALAALQRAVARDGSRASAWALLGELHFKAGDSTAARQAWERAPDEPIALLGLARMEADAGDRPSAIARLQRAVGLEPSLGAAHALLASLLAAEQQPRRATVVAALAVKYGSVPAQPSRALAAVQRQTRDVERLAVLADLALLRDQPLEALEWAQRAVNSDARAWRAWLAMGFVELRRGELDAARRAYERALALGGERVTLTLELAEVDRREGKFAAARTRLLEAEALGVSRARIRLALGEIELAAGNRAQAEVHLRESLAADANAPGALRTLGQLLWETERFEEAQPLLERLRAADPLDFASRATLAEELARRGEHEGALPLFREAIDLAPDNRALRELAARSAAALAQQCIARRDAPGAVTHARTALEFAPHQFEPLARFAALAAATGVVDEAAAQAEAYTARQPRDAKGWLLLGDLRLLLRQPDAARSAWERARDAAPAPAALQQEIARRLGAR